MEFYKTRALGKKKRRARKVDKDLAGAPWGYAFMRCAQSAPQIASAQTGADMLHRPSWLQYSITAGQ